MQLEEKAGRLPHWLRRKHSISELHEMKARLRGHGLHSVCEEARCPNKAECFKKPTATFLILGPSCTRGCSFCSVVSGKPPSPDPGEPRRVADAAMEMGLKYVVITSVTRDDLPDGGAGVFASTVAHVKDAIPGVRVEVLVPDFKGNASSIHRVLDSGSDVFNHNLETVPSLYSEVRPQARYQRSLGVLEVAKAYSPDIRTKSGLMLGLGETMDEIIGALRDLRAVGCDFLTMGQYMRPGRDNTPVRQYIKPEVFDKLKDTALAMGFIHVASAPLVRSSMNAEEMYLLKS